MGFTRNEQMGCLEAFRGNTNGSKHLHNVKSHVGFSRNVSGENMVEPEKSKNVLKIAKIKGYNTRFRTFLGSELRTPQDAS